MRLATIPSNLPFLDTLARRWLDDSDGEAGDGVVVLPTRRAARALTEAFLRVAGGRPLLLPRLVAIGGLDEVGLGPGAGFGEAAMLPPPVDPVRRQAELTRLILAREQAAGSYLAPDLAWRMAAELVRLLDDAQRAEVDLGRALHAAGGEGFASGFAEHWQQTLRFLAIVTEAWPAWLAQARLMDPVARQMRALRLCAAAWQARPPAGRVIAAGVSVTNPASAALLAVIARLPRGLVLLPGLDTALGEADWEALDESHPQADLRRLLAALGARREEVADWHAADDTAVVEVSPGARAALLNRALRPAAGLGDWLADTAPVLLDGLWRIAPDDPEEEAQAIALVLRDALQVPGRRAALVTPDRALATRVVTALARWSVHVEDSVGEPLAGTPPAVLLRLLLAAVEDQLAPVALLALLKHPLTTLGLPPALCRARARRLERTCLRGPRPAPGLAGLRAALAAVLAAQTRTETEADAVAELHDLIDRLEACLAPIVACTEAKLPDLLGALVRSAEALTRSADAPLPERAATSAAATGPDELWSGEEGAALSMALAALIDEGDVLPPLRRAELGRFLEAALAPHLVRTRRALRGRSVQAEHPRLFVWGLLEARLQTAELIVLGGLGEGVWPAATDPGPWLSRPMRTALGLDPAERQVGTEAADFLRIACGAPEVLLSAPRRREGTPLVPSRWMVRLDAFLQGRGQALREHPCLAWARALDRPPGGIARPVAPPRPAPPVSRRPRRLSITEIDTLKADPYAIYARHVLRLRKLDPPQLGADHADFGQVVHAGLAEVLGKTNGVGNPPAPGADDPLEAALCRALEEALAGNARVNAPLAAWWRPRLRRIAAWVAQRERAWRAEFGVVRTLTERAGTLSFTPAGAVAPFELTGRADRIDLGADGALALLDYKTGVVPKDKDVAAGWMSQLPLGAAMALNGGFGDLAATRVATLAYWRLGGGIEPGDVSSVDGDAAVALVAEAWAGLGRLIAEYDDPVRPYLSHPRPDRAPRYADYRQLARHAEWSNAGGEEAS